ncbi:MAG TPA: SDR family oxidoreductase [Burkholderiales bacterium]|nr:SDR family oxidoreductase [Burkholderiales bacterium]
MLEHHSSKPEKPARVVVCGASGFVGGAVASRLERDGIPVLRVGRNEADLAAPDAHERLAALLRPGDAFVAAAARAPVKNADMLVENMVMARAMVRALSKAPVAHVVNISSDAVYSDSDEPLTESSCASPGSLHGAMHLAREVIFRSEVKAPLAILRPSLLYGAADPHNGYGPNRFRRLAAKGEDIVLFGEGEERRDHVFIDDVAALVARVLYRRSTGVLNIATGEVHSFAELAGKIISLSKKAARIKTTPRSGPMPHNGYRPFDIAACRKAFPDFRFTSLEEGLRKSQNG